MCRWFGWLRPGHAGVSPPGGYAVATDDADRRLNAAPAAPATPSRAAAADAGPGDDRQRPDVVIMDIRMPVLDGVAATALLTAGGRDGPTRVLIITAFDLDEYVVEALRAGASGFLVKD